MLKTKSILSEVKKIKKIGHILTIFFYIMNFTAINLSWDSWAESVKDLTLEYISIEASDLVGDLASDKGRSLSFADVNRSKQGIISHRQSSVRRFCYTNVMLIRNNNYGRDGTREKS